MRSHNSNNQIARSFDEQKTEINNAYEKGYRHANYMPLLMSSCSTFVSIIALLTKDQLAQGIGIGMLVPSLMIGIWSCINARPCSSQEQTVSITNSGYSSFATNNAWTVSDNTQPLIPTVVVHTPSSLRL